MLFVRGFRSKHSALAFEYAWQKPHSSRHTAHACGASRDEQVFGSYECQRASLVRRRTLSLLLEHIVLL